MITFTLITFHEYTKYLDQNHILGQQWGDEVKIVSSKDEITDFLGQDIGNLLFALYDGLIRIVDPTAKSVELLMGQIENSKHTKRCFSMWSINSACSNCISLRAIMTNQPVSKLETDGEEIFLVHSLPLTLPTGKKVALEVLKNLTDVHIESYSSNLGIDIDPELSILLKSINNLNNRVYKDNLTGAYNREYLSTQIPDKIKNVASTFMMIDLDNFKQINDKYGHIAGDAVLQSFAKTVDKLLRKDKDYLIRYGGDEFVVLLSDTNEYFVKAIVERFKNAVSVHPAKFLDIEIAYSISIGCYTTTKSDHDLNIILQKADEAMYLDKNVQL